MNLPRRNFLHLAAGVAALPAMPHVARAQTYPQRSVRLVVGFPAGSAADIVARLMGQWLSEQLGQQFIIENRPGAGGNIGTATVVRAAPDGYALLHVNPANAISATLYEKLNFNFIRDIAPVASINSAPYVMVVNPALPVKTVPEFIAFARANPGKINMASAGIGSPQHIFGELFKMMASVSLTHVPYRGGPPAIVDLIGGQVHVMVNVMSTLIEHIRASELRALAVTTMTRSLALPDIPTVGEFVPGYEASGWGGLAAPRNTPIEIVGQLNRAINAGVAEPKIKERFAQLGIVPMPMTPAEFVKFIEAETEKWGKVIRVGNIKAE